MIVVVGISRNYQPSCGPGGSTSFSSLALARYTPDGGIDASFGSAGTVTTGIPCTNVGAAAQGRERNSSVACS